MTTSENKLKKKKLSKEHVDFPEFDDRQLEYLLSRFTPVYDKDDTDSVLRWKAAQQSLLDEIVDSQLAIDRDREQGVRSGNSPQKMYDKN